MSQVSRPWKSCDSERRVKEKKNNKKNMKFYYRSKQSDINQLKSSRRVSIIIKNCAIWNFYVDFVGVACASHED